MSDFGETWKLVRGRFDDAVLDLNQEQLNWRLHEEALTLGETAIHVAGVEIWFVSQLRGETMTPELARVAAASRDGVLNEKPFPFGPAEITPEKVRWALDTARQFAAPLIEDLTHELRSRQMESALGPIVDGAGACARLAYHPGYHQGQAQLIRSAPGFPG